MSFIYYKKKVQQKNESNMASDIPSDLPTTSVNMTTNINAPIIQQPDIPKNSSLESNESLFDEGERTPIKASMATDEGFTETGTSGNDV